MANNVNNGITGVIDIPGALRSRGAADGNLVGGVVAYAGDIYDTTAGKNLATINAEVQLALNAETSVSYNDLTDKPFSVTTSSSGVSIKAGTFDPNTTNHSLALGAESRTLSANNSVALGKGCKSDALEIVLGRYNVLTFGCPFVVGCGTSDSNRKNAIVVGPDDKVFINGINGYTGGSVSSNMSTDTSFTTYMTNIGSRITSLESNIPTKVSDLTNDSGYLTQHQTLPDIVDNVVTNDATKVLSAKQGKLLNDRVTTLENAEITAEDVSYDSSETYSNGTVGNAIQTGITASAASAAAAASSASDAQGYISSLNTAMSLLANQQDVTAYVAANQADIAGLKSNIVVDLSVRYTTSYANLSAALTALNSDTATDATAIKKAGVSVKFINSTTNKYEQWNLKASSWSTNASDWALDVDGSVTSGKLKLPFELEKPSSNEYVTQASEIGYKGSSVEKKLDDAVYSPGINILDKSNVKEGYLINVLGIEAENSSYNCTDYIPVTAGDEYADATESVTPFRFIDFYDSDKVHLSTRYSDQHTFTVPENAAYMRVSLYANTYYDNYALLAKTSERIAYTPFTPIGGYNADNIRNNIVTENKIANGAVTENKLGSAVKEKLNLAASVQKKVNEDVVLKSSGINLFDKSQATENAIVNTNGDIQTGYSTYVTSGLIKCIAGEKYSKAIGNNGFRFVAFYNSGKSFLSRIEDTATFTVPENATYFRVTVYTSQYSNAQVIESENPLAFTEFTPIGGYAAEKLKDGTVTSDAIQNGAVTAAKLGSDIPIATSIKDHVSTNLANPSDIKDGYWNGQEIESTSYKYIKIDISKLVAGTTLSFLWSDGEQASGRFVQFYRGSTRDTNSGGTYLTSAVIPANVDSVYISVESYRLNHGYEIGVFNTASPTWEAYGNYAVANWTKKPVDAPQALVRFSDIASIVSSKLKGKKWAPLGDSFTQGVTGTRLEDGKYAGKYRSYPYFIGNRTEIDVLETFFQAGRTLAFPETPGTFTNSICNPSASCFYQNIPIDVDYITIYLGINDSHHAPGSSGGDGEDNTGVIPIGTITDNTTYTYYGAWNVVLSWLIENRPFAHIGIIVSNGCDTVDYRTAQLEIARKYGIPFIDLNGDDRTPCMIRSMNADIASSVRQMRTIKQAVDYDGSQTGSVNLHPNDDAHLYESYFIENFLMTL